MPKNANDHGRYIRKVEEQTKRYAQELLADNEALRILTTSLRGDNQQLRDQLALLREESSLHAMRRQRLESQLQHVEREHEHFAQEYLEIEKQNSNLANLYVASYRLHGILDQEELLLALLEIIANLVGSEEVAIFDLEGDGSSLRLIGSTGVDQAAYTRIPVDSGAIGNAVATGETYVASVDGADTGLTACIPLKLGDEVKGAIAIFRLLSHKPKLEPADSELFELLSTQAGAALYCAKLNALLGGRLP